MTEPLVSVVIPTYNRAAIVVRALETVFAQREDNLQVIVVDDASTDDTETRIRRAYGDRVQYVRNDVRRGPGAARNRGLELATGPYVAFLDSDDLWLEEKLQRQVALVARGADIVYCTALLVDLSGRVIAIQRARTRGDLRRPLLGRNVIAGSASAVLVRRSCLEAVGGFQTGVYSEDWDLWLRLSFRFQFDFVPEPLVQITIDPSSRHRAAPADALAESLERIYDGLLADPASARFVRQHRPILRAGIEYATAAQHRSFGETADAFRRFLRCVTAKPFQARAYAALMLLPMGRAALRRARSLRSTLLFGRFNGR